MKNRILTIGLTLLCFLAGAQPEKVLTLESCYELARQNYPLVKQHELISKSKEYSIENASKGYLPQLNLMGQASYQSAVTTVPMKLPGLNIPSLSKDQYKIFGELNQTLYDGGSIRMQKQILETNALVEAQKLEVELYKLKDRINQVFFGIILLHEQINQTNLFMKDIQNSIQKMNAAIKNGIALKNSEDILQAELLKAGQRIIELKANRESYYDMLGLFINQKLDESVPLQIPASTLITATISRPELALFENQKKMLTVQNGLLNTRNRPKLGLFFQGGYGKPGMDMLNNNFTDYYIGGLRFNWSLSGLYTYKNEKSLLSISSNTLDLQKETFLFNTNYVLKYQNAEIVKLEKLLKTDEEILSLRTRIKNTAHAQLENGVIQPNDYLRELNAEDLARQNKLLHRIQLLMAQYNQKNTTGN